MNTHSRFAIIALIVIAVVLCLALVAGVVLVGGLLLRPANSTLSGSPTPITLTEAQPGQTTPQAGTDASTSAAMDKIQGEVVAIRGLEATKDVPRKLMTTKELMDTVTNDFLKNYTPEDAAKDTQNLSLLGLLPSDFDLLDFYKKLYSEQIAGYYDDKTKEMFVISDVGFTGVEKATYAHEYTHALQDQHFDFEGKLNYTEDSCKADSERCAAIQSLIEGDATLTQTMWLQTDASQQDVQDIQKYYSSYSSPVYDSAPAFMQEDFTFPYLQGYDFVKALYTNGGFAAINTAFTTQHPVSTEQILHPAKYPADVPLKVSLPDLAAGLGKDWQESESDVVGEWYTYLILAKAYEAKARLQDSIAKDAADGWGGDAYSIVENSQNGELALAVRYVWDTKADAIAALAAFESYSGLRFGEPDAQGVSAAGGYYSQLIAEGDTGFTWLVAQSAETLTQLAGLVSK